MRVLLVDGFPAGHRSELSATAAAELERLGHEVESLTLVESGFDQFMSEEERRAYHETDNIVTAPQQRSVALVRSVDAIIVCCPIVAGTVVPVVKGWFERTFVPGVAFTISDGGRLTPALTNLMRIAMVTECPLAGERRIHGRDGSGRSLVRALRMNANLRCRASYASVKPSDGPKAGVARAVKHWPTP